MNQRVYLIIKEDNAMVDKYNLDLSYIRPAKYGDLLEKDHYLVVVPKEMYEWLKKKHQNAPTLRNNNNNN